jgi:arginine deiminase
VSPGASRGMPDSLHQRLAFYPDPRIFGNRLVVVLAGASHRVFKSTLQGLNQSIVGLSTLYETTYSTSHEIPNDGS